MFLVLCWCCFTIACAGMKDVDKLVWTIINLEHPPPKVLDLLNERIKGFNAVEWREKLTSGTILHLAVCAGRIKKMKLLLERGSDVNATDIRGGTPLCRACEEGRLDMVKVLVGHGADIHRAAITVVPVEEGAEESGMVVDGMSPLACALMHKKMDVFDYLLTQGARANSTGLALATCNGLPTLETLLAAEMEGSFDSPFYEHMIVTAAANGQGECLSTLLRAGPEVFPPSLQEDVIMVAISANQLPVIRAMYDTGWRLPNEPLGRGVLHHSVKKSTELWEYLIFSVGCDPNAPPAHEGNDEDGLPTVLHLACMFGTVEHVSLAIWADADVDAMDSLNLPPIAWALYGGNRYSRLVYRYLEYCGVTLKGTHVNANHRKVLRYFCETMFKNDQVMRVDERSLHTKEEQEQEFQRVLCGIKRRVRARVKARCRSPQDLYPLLCAVRSEPAPLVSQTAVDRSIDRFYSQRDTAAQVQVQVVTRDSVVAADGCVYERAALKGWIEECLREDGVIVSPTTGQVMSSTVLLPACTLAM